MNGATAKLEATYVARESVSRDAVSRSLRVLDDAVTEHKPRHIVALFSGGGDSVVATHLAARRYDFHGCLFVDTGTALSGVRAHVLAVSDAMDWPLAIRHPPEPYEQMIRDAGLPGPGMHGTAYVRLKERVFDAYVRELCSKDHNGRRCSRHDTVLWVAGSRRSESERRMRNAAKAVEKDGSQVWVNVIHDWTAEQVAAYRELHSLPLSDISALVHRSGECNCGTYAQPGEREMLAALDPAFARRIDQWEALAIATGHPHAAIWGQRPARVAPGQCELVPRVRARACSSCESLSLTSTPSSSAAPEIQDSPVSGVVGGKP